MSDYTGRLADELGRRGLRAPAALLLDAHRPLLPLLRQVGIFSGPLIGPLIGVRRMAGLHVPYNPNSSFLEFTFVKTRPLRGPNRIRPPWNSPSAAHPKGAQARVC